MPNFVQAGAYSAVTNYLKAVQAVKTDDAAVVMKQLKSMPINDMFARNGRIRADGRMVHDMYLVQVKALDQIKERWDYYTVKARSCRATRLLQPPSGVQVSPGGAIRTTATAGYGSRAVLRILGRLSLRLGLDDLRVHR